MEIFVMQDTNCRTKNQRKLSQYTKESSMPFPPLPLELTTMVKKLYKERRQ